VNAPESSNYADILALAKVLSVLLVKAAEAGTRKALEQMPSTPEGGDKAEIYPRCGSAPQGFHCYAPQPRFVAVSNSPHSGCVIAFM